MPKLAEKIYCTGCGVCADACSRGSISMLEDEFGCIYPSINADSCVDCGLCEKICPVLNLPKLNYPRKSYACWNTDAESRRNSASGGIAAALYEDSISKGYKAVGAAQNDDFSVSMQIANTKEELLPFKNSKYVYCSVTGVYRKVKELLKAGENVIVIGLPCHIAAFKKFFPKNDNLFLVDLVCHGSIPTMYLQQHIANIEKNHSIKASKMSFRAPEKGTESYYFTLYDNKNTILYSMRSVDNELYNVAFHGGIAYRENCYHCKFARPERVGDITIGDYHGLGEMAPCEYSQDKVSVMLVNTNKGDCIISSLSTIHKDERPVEEAINGDVQLRRPSLKHKRREDFEKYIKKYNGDFDAAVEKVLKLHTRREKYVMYRALPKRILKKIYRVITSK